ncbi:peptide chain release factor N(5)-glutamine methyltransferase [Phenylobacterium sp.]|jgi:release factor glutamine methyltransferase|uniref:peptide chain release factor N(5)-glutamine methyltransferase n=1 Tax=Phenylobacterium sp. TaxID=1871053 RepID=UPI0025E00DF2|nr:peptide chain release factor N(5)-glutamine methyltransferase [Phenylobacterium sp.]MCA3720105.1 peptide chain release factor N(5)-glutamine methyltransferase [Phenylobacterium sp.]
MSRNLLQAWQGARARLEAAGVPGPVIDARVLVEAACGVTRADIVGDPYREISPEKAARLDDYLERRIRREPVSHILGRRGFWNIMLGVTPGVLTPRPETEVIVDHALRLFPEGRSLRILDLGVGSGAILLAILAERPAARGLGVDVSEEALAVARENAANLGLAGRVALLRGDWTAGLAEAEFDLVVSNPPYIATDVIETLDPEVRVYEPRLALDGGADGLDAFRRLAPEILRVLKPGGRFLVEIGYDQRTAVETLFRGAGAVEVETLQDLSTHDRVVAGAKKPLETAV